MATIRRDGSGPSLAAVATRFLRDVAEGCSVDVFGFAAAVDAEVGQVAAAARAVAEGPDAFATSRACRLAAAVLGLARVLAEEDSGAAEQDSDATALRR